MRPAKRSRGKGERSKEGTEGTQGTKAERAPGKGGRSQPTASRRSSHETADTDILILSDGTVLAHNLTPGMAKVLHKLNPKDEAIRARAGRKPRRPKDSGEPGSPPPPAS